MRSFPCHASSLLALLCGLADDMVAPHTWSPSRHRLDQAAVTPTARIPAWPINRQLGRSGQTTRFTTRQQCDMHLGVHRTDRPVRVESEYLGRRTLVSSCCPRKPGSRHVPKPMTERRREAGTDPLGVAAERALLAVDLGGRLTRSASAALGTSPSSVVRLYWLTAYRGGIQPRRRPFTATLRASGSPVDTSSHRRRPRLGRGRRRWRAAPQRRSPYARRVRRLRFAR